MKYLIAQGADLNAVNSTGKNAVQLALEGGHTDVMVVLVSSGAKIY